MNITTKGHYGVMAMVELATREGEGPVSLKSIAQNQGLSEHYLEQIFAPMRRAGLVRSVRGAQGGYLLAKPAKDTSVGDILRVLEGQITPFERGAEGNEDQEGSDSPFYPMVSEIWQRLYQTMQQVVDGITLDDLCQRAREAQARKSFMFYI